MANFNSMSSWGFIEQRFINTLQNQNEVIYDETFKEEAITDHKTNFYSQSTINSPNVAQVMGLNYMGTDHVATSGAVSEVTAESNGQASDEKPADQVVSEANATSEGKPSKKSKKEDESHNSGL